MRKVLITAIALLVVFGLMGGMVLANGATKYDLSPVVEGCVSSGTVIINFTGAGNDEVIANIQVSTDPYFAGAVYQVRSGEDIYGDFIIGRNGKARINIKVSEFEGQRINIWLLNALNDWKLEDYTDIDGFTWEYVFYDVMEEPDNIRGSDVRVLRTEIIPGL